MLLTADSLDIEYDNISHALVISGFWGSSPAGGWTEDIPAPARGDKVEFGLLGAEPGIILDELKMGGLLGIVGEDKKLSA